MEEREVELIDYLRVAWRGKWIVLACFVLVVGAATAIIWTKAPDYSLSASYEVQETLALYALSQETQPLYAPSPCTAILAKYAAQALPDLNTTGLQRYVRQRDPDLVDVTIRGTGSAEVIENALASSAQTLEASLIDQVEQALARERASAVVELERLAREAAVLRERMATEPDEAVRLALANSVASLEARLADVSVRYDALKGLSAGELVSLREISRSSVVEASRNAKTTLAAAGLLGLGSGLLLAFFVHYLVSAARKDKAACGGT